MLFWNATMDRALLKRTLKEQAIPLDEAVQQKINYLLSDDVFAPAPESEPVAEDMSFADAFGSVTAPNRAVNHTPSPLQEKAESFAEHKQSMAEKIAALRGISDVSAIYMRHNKQ